MSGKVMGSSSPLEDSASHNNILKPFDFDFQGIFDSQNISRSTSDIGDMRNMKIVSKISEEVMESPLEESILDIIFEPFDEQPSSGRWSKIVLSKSFAFSSSKSDLNLDLSYQNDAVYGPSLQPLKKMINIILHMIWQGWHLKNHTAWKKGNKTYQIFHFLSLQQHFIMGSHQKWKLLNHVKALIG